MQRDASICSAPSVCSAPSPELDQKKLTFFYAIKIDVNAIECILALHTCFVEPLLNSNEKVKKVVKNCLVFSVMQAYASAFCMHLYASCLCMHMYAGCMQHAVCRLYAAECNMVRNYTHHGKKLHLSPPKQLSRPTVQLEERRLKTSRERHCRRS